MRRANVTLAFLILVVLFLFRFTPTLEASTSILIREWSVPTPNTGPHDPALAPDGSLWYTGQLSNRLGRLDPATGQTREYVLPRPGSGPHGLVADRDGNIWFTGNTAGYIGKLDPLTGNVTEYRMPDARAGDPHTPIFDRKGILWFTVQGGNFVGKLDPRTGEVTLRASPTPNSRPYGIVVSPEGTLFYCEFGSNRIAAINPETMEITEYVLPASGARPRRLAITPDGMIYYSDYNRGYLGRLDPRTGRTDEWLSPAGARSEPYGVASTADGAVWYSESGVQPNTLVRFDPETQSFEKWPIPSGGGVVRHIVTTPGGQIYLACSGVNKVGIAFVFSAQTRFALPERGVSSRITGGAADAADAADAVDARVTAGYSRILTDAGSTAPSGFAIFSLRQGGVLVSEASVPAAPFLRSGRVFVNIGGPVKTGLAVANPNDRPATLSFYFTDSSGRDFNAGTIVIPANGQIARFLDESPFNGGNSLSGSLTFSSDVSVGAIALRGYTNERSEFLMTTLPVIDLAPRTGNLFFPHFAVGGGWSTEVQLVNPGETVLTGSVLLRASGQPFANFDYAIQPKSARTFPVSGSNSLDGETIRTGAVIVVPAAGSQSPDGNLVLTFKRGAVVVSEAGVGAVRAGLDFRVYAESSESVQTGIAIANPSAARATVNVELIAATGESSGSATLDVAGDGHVAMFLNQIGGLTAPRNFEGMVRLSTTSPGGIVATGLRGRYNERGDFLITSTPVVDAMTALFPHIVDGGGYSTQFVLLSGRPGSAPSGLLRFYAQGGQPLELSLR